MSGMMRGEFRNLPSWDGFRCDFSISGLREGLGGISHFPISGVGEGRVRL